MCNSPNPYLCQKCADKLPFYTNNEDKKHFAPFTYEEPVRSMILSLKYRDNGLAARGLAPYMAATFMREMPKKDYVIIPVPLCRARLRERGYNQSELLAREFAEYIKMPVLTDVLIRVKKTAPQKNMTAKQRAENMGGAFSVTDAALIKGRHILLIDDVYTTGATTDECAKVLRAAGARGIKVLTITKTVS
jgi:ComF family protein